MTITWGENRSLSTEIRGHEVKIEPGAGEVPGPTPADMFLFALGGCVAVYAADYAVRHDIPTEGMKIEVDYGVANKPKRISDVRIQLTMPGEVPEKFRAPLVRAAGDCYLHNTVQHGPNMRISLT